MELAEKDSHWLKTAWTFQSPKIKSISPTCTVVPEVPVRQHVLTLPMPMLESPRVIRMGARGRQTSVMMSGIQHGTDA